MFLCRSCGSSWCVCCRVFFRRMCVRRDIFAVVVCLFVVVSYIYLSWFVCRRGLLVPVVCVSVVVDLLSRFV